MNTNPDIFAAAFHAHAHQAHPEKPEPLTDGFRGRTALQIMGCLAAEAHPDGPLVEAVGPLPFVEGRPVVGPTATALSDGLLPDEVDTMELDEVLAKAISADRALARPDGGVR